MFIMKNTFIILILFIISLCFGLFISVKDDVRVLKVVSPSEIFIDTNNNYILDESNPVKILNLNYVNKDSDLSEYESLKDLTEDEKFFISYMQMQFVNRLIKGKRVRYKNSDLFINGKSYRQILLQSSLFFDDTDETQKKFFDKVKSYNLDDYVIYNIRSRRYHRINCKTGKESKFYKIIEKEKLNPDAVPCNYCINKKPEVIGIKNKYKTEKIKFVKSSYSIPKIKVYFLDLNKTFKPESTCKTEACIALKNEINNAKETIDFAIYGIENQPELFNALTNAYKRGVKIRWVTDYDRKNGNYYKDTLKLQKAIPSFKSDNNYENKTSNLSAIMHNKFFIIDKKKVWTGSSNITKTGITEFNANYSVLIDSESAAQIFTKEFENMYSGKFHNQKAQIQKSVINIGNDVKLYIFFSPGDKIINTQIIPLINRAKKYIYIPIFYITNNELSDALINAHNRGVDVKIINDSTNAHNKYSIHKKLRSAGIKVKTENYAGKMHMKAMFIDDSVSLIGSMNFTKNANIRNDENVIIIYNTELTQYLKNTFLYLWDKIPEKYLYYDPVAEGFESVGSCFDGIDNDFDDKIDSEDEGCKVK